MTSVSSSVNPSGIVVPAGGLQQSNVAMTTINSQVVSGKHMILYINIKPSDPDTDTRNNTWGFTGFLMQCHISKLENR